MKTDFFRGLAFACLLALTARPVLPQASTGSVRGTVRDQTEAVLPNAEVTLANTATNVSIKSTTNSSGFYVLPGLTPAQYRLTVTAPGMARYEADLTVLVQQSTTADVVM